MRPCSAPVPTLGVHYTLYISASNTQNVTSACTCSIPAETSHNSDMCLSVPHTVVHAVSTIVWLLHIQTIMFCSSVFKQSPDLQLLNSRCPGGNKSKAIATLLSHQESKVAQYTYTAPNITKFINVYRSYDSHFALDFKLLDGHPKHLHRSYSTDIRLRWKHWACR